MPNVTEYSCRLKNPKRFQQKTFRRISSGDVDLVIARPYGKKKTRAQAIRYPRELWDEHAARRSCRKHKGKFETARKPDLSGASIPAKKKYPYYPYDVIKRENQWYVIGHTGGKYWMPVSSGYRTKREATARAKRQLQADRTARRLVSEV